MRERPATIILTEINNRGSDAREQEISVPVASIRKFITEDITLWEKQTPRQAKVTIIEHLDRDTTMVKESVRYITKLMNGFIPSTTTHGDNAECPQVLSGEWTRCQGHQS